MASTFGCFVKNLECRQQNKQFWIMAEKDLYLQKIGSLMYLSNLTKTDISFAIKMLSRKVANPTVV